MSKNNHIFNFNCSKNTLICELDKLKVVNADKSINTNLLCRRINNKVKFMLYTNNTPGTYAYHKTVLDEYSFEGEIFGDESTSSISGSFRNSLFINFGTVLGLIFTIGFIIMTLWDGFIILPIVLLPVIFIVYMFYMKNHTQNRILVRIKGLEKKLNSN
ncbi:hypothetical protein [Terrisporobacter glycolicus]|uniref:ABC transmembrane type-1 domain-containing protein n=1 Tax=Terrisporobacter glycolicus ATCC 14880 = DSM 1288 TaxID=1121315 RepID=A0ABZ2ERH4_9FIRM|nr:hypothetical protein [Terrisporobacter glycolicus]